MTMLPQRKHVRLPGYNYASAGAYFVTICTTEPLCLLGEVSDGEVKLNELGRIVQEVLTTQTIAHTRLEAYVIMPNHVHMIVFIEPEETGGSRTAPTAGRKSLGRIVGALKTASAHKINVLRGTPGSALWQRNYYEHVIRNDEDFYNIRKYIQENPMKWEMDKENPKNS
jgi:putative transposase